MSDEDEGPKNITAGVLLAGAILFVLGVFFFIGQPCLDWLVVNDDDAEVDYQAAATLFSGLAFSFLVYTAILQRQELKLQREELTKTREVFKEQAAIAEKHLKILTEESAHRERFRALELDPVFSLRQENRGGKITLFNAGAAIYDLRIEKCECYFPDDEHGDSLVLENSNPRLSDWKMLDHHHHVEISLNLRALDRENLVQRLYHYGCVVDLLISFKDKLDKRKVAPLKIVGMTYR